MHFIKDDDHINEIFTIAYKRRNSKKWRLWDLVWDTQEEAMIKARKHFGLSKGQSGIQIRPVRYIRDPHDFAECEEKC